MWSYSYLKADYIDDNDKITVLSNNSMFHFIFSLKRSSGYIFESVPLCSHGRQEKYDSIFREKKRKSPSCNIEPFGKWDAFSEHLLMTLQGGTIAKQLIAKTAVIRTCTK